MSGSNNSTIAEEVLCDLNFLDFQLIPINIRRPIGICLFLGCLCSLWFYCYVIFVIVKHKLYKSHPFFLWFVSIGLGDVSNLLNYLFSFFLTCFDVYPVSKFAVVCLGHFYQFAYNVCLFHFPAMALIRTLNILFPVRTKGWFSIRTMTILISIVWILAVANTIFLQSFKGNWMFFDPSKLSFTNVCWDPEGPFQDYWNVVPPVFFLSADVLYAVCFVKLRLHNKVIVAASGENSNAAKAAEKNLLKVGLSITLIMTCDHVSWLVSLNCFQGWWSTLLLSVIEVAMFTMNAFFIAFFNPTVSAKITLRTITTSVSFDVYPISKLGVVCLGHFYQFAYNVCLFHFPAMAFIRTLNILFPMRTKGWFTVRTMSIQIIIVWLLLALANTIFLQSFKENWMFFDPSKLSFSDVWWEPSGAFQNYWNVVPPVFFLSSDVLYLLLNNIKQLLTSSNNFQPKTEFLQHPLQ